MTLKNNLRCSSRQMCSVRVSRACKFGLLLMLSPHGHFRYPLALLHLPEALWHGRRYGLGRKSALVLLVLP